MGNSATPENGERYADFCSRTNWHNKNRVEHQKIMKFFEKFDIHTGSIYCYSDDINLKQKQIIRMMERNNAACDFNCAWFTEYYLCFLSPELLEEFNTIDTQKRDELFQTIKFSCSATDKLQEISYSNRICKYNVPGSSWWYAEWSGDLPEDRRQFIGKLAGLGFANSRIYQDKYGKYTDIYLYCTKEQAEIFNNGYQPLTNYKEIEQKILKKHRSDNNQTKKFEMD